jgi:Holliday junction DNA helicase RuvA
MIYYLRGSVLKIFTDSCLVVAQNIGYKVYLGKNTLQYIALSQEVELWIEPTVHEGMTKLFGFLTEDEHLWFCWLIQVPGVGGKVGQNLLSSFPPDQLYHLVMTQDAPRLKTGEGVGPKLASRLVTELKDKALTWTPSCAQKDPLDDAVLTLCALGYKEQEARRMLKWVQDHFSPTSLEETIKIALNRLAHHDV